MSPRAPCRRTGSITSLRRRVPSARAAESPASSSSGAAQNSIPITAASSAHCALRAREVVDPCGEERLDRRRDRELGRRIGGLPAVTVDRSGGRRRSACAGPARRRGGCRPRARPGAPGTWSGSASPIIRSTMASVSSAESGRSEIVVGQRTSHSSRCLEQLEAGHADEQDRALDAVGELEHQVEQPRLRPVEVVEDDDHGSPRGDDLEQPADGPARLLRRAGRRPRARPAARGGSRSPLLRRRPRARRRASPGARWSSGPPRSRRRRGSRRRAPSR